MDAVQACERAPLQKRPAPAPGMQPRYRLMMDRWKWEGEAEPEMWRKEIGGHQTEHGLQRNIFIDMPNSHFFLLSLQLPRDFPCFLKTHRPTYIRFKSAVWLINVFTGIGGKMEGGHDPLLVFSLHLGMDNKSWTEELQVLRGINPLHARDWLVDDHTSRCYALRDFS